MSTLKTNNIQHVDRSDPSILINTDGSVSIAGTMTYEDVTNVDAVGIITGRSLINAQKQVHVGTGVSVKSGGLNVTAGITTVQNLQAQGDVSIAGITTISYSGTATYGLDVSNSTSGSSGARISAGDSDSQYSFLVENRLGTNLFEVMAGGGGANLRSGSLYILDKIIHYGDNNTAIRFPDTDTIAAETGGSERVRIINTGEVSIGGFTPTASAGILQIAGGLRVAGSASASDTTTPYIYRTSGVDNLNFATNGAERLRIASNGKVTMTSTTNNLRGLSVIAPKTQINFGTTSDKGGFLMSEADGQFGLSGGGYWSGSNWTATHTGSAQIRHDGAGIMVFCTNTSLTSGNTFTPTERLRITSAGDLGINNTSPSAKLDVVDDSASGYIAEFRQGNTSNSAQIAIDSPTDSDARPVLIDMQRAGTLKWSIGQGYNSSGGAFHFATSSLSAGVTGVKASFLTGGGLTFNGDTSSDNALDDYEQGTWTPTAVPVTLSGTIAGHYTKIGDLCYVSCIFVVPTNSNTSDIEINGLPFNGKNGTDGNYIQGGYVIYHNQGGGPYTVLVANNSNQLVVYQANGQRQTFDQFSNKHLRLAAVYKVA